jgi:hypothetical protein
MTIDPQHDDRVCRVNELIQPGVASDFDGPGHGRSDDRQQDRDSDTSSIHDFSSAECCGAAGGNHAER